MFPLAGRAVKPYFLLLPALALAVSAGLRLLRVSLRATEVLREDAVDAGFPLKGLAWPLCLAAAGLLQVGAADFRLRSELLPLEA